MKTTLSVAFFLLSISCIAQVSISTDASQPDSSAMLDIKSTTRGLLIPRMTAMQRTAIASPATGLLVYQTDEPAGYYYYDGIDWLPLAVRSESGFSGTVFDVEGNTYRTVRIGDQEWFAENLRTTHFANGESITLGTNSLTSGYSWYNFEISYKIPYGGLYNYYAVVDSRGLCPTGWKVPNNNDWIVLQTYLGGSQNAAKSMELANLWNPPVQGVTNSSGFSGVPGGYCSGGLFGNFLSLGSYSYFWSTTELNVVNAKPWLLNRDPLFISVTTPPSQLSKKSGYSVRCLKGNPCVIPQSFAGNDQLHLTGTTTTLQANTPNTGTGQWIVAGIGGVVAEPVNPNSQFNGFSGSTYHLTWKITSDCGTSQDQVKISFECLPQPTLPNAGPDQINVAGTSTNLQGNIPTIGVGAWNIVDNSENGYISSPSNPASTFTGLPGHTYTLRWTTTGCQGDTYEDIVIISFACPNYSPSNAGPDFAAPYEFIHLEGNDPGPGGTGFWQIISQPCITVNSNGVFVYTAGSIIDINDRHSGYFCYRGCPQTLRWTTTSPCGTTTQDDVTITLGCSDQDHFTAIDHSSYGTTHSIEGMFNTNPGYSGTWSIISGVGGSIANPTSPETTFTGLPGSSYLLLWSVVTPSGCHSAAGVNVSFDVNCNTPPIPNAGPDQLNLQGISTTLQANTPGGNGLWFCSEASGIIADPSNPSSTFTGLPGHTYILTWRITFTCGIGFSDDYVTISFQSCPAITSNAGPDQLNIPGTSTTLQANTPTGGNFQWSIISGSGGNISAPTNPASTFTGLAGISYVLRWTVSNDCQTLTDDVNISFQCVPQPTPSNAGPDQLNIVGLSATLQANTPTSGTGQWSIVSGTGGNITTPSNPASTFTGIEGNSYTLRWTITACTTSVDDVVISFACPVPNAGPDQLQLPGTSTTLQAAVPFVGTGAWSPNSGIAQLSNPTSTFSGLEGLSYSLRWNITSNCPASYDDVVISFVCANPPTTANAGPDQLNIQGASTTLQGNTPIVGTGFWTIASGTGGVISQPLNPSSTFIGTSGNTYLLVWNIISGNCTSLDGVTISFSTFTCGNTFVDTRDYQVYTTVQIGAQCWMKQNLNFSVGTSSCYGGLQTNCDNYGRQYDWSTASTACPTGWHLPSQTEWCTLVQTIDGTVACGTTGMLLGIDAGGKMKETGITYWQAPNTGATNSSGFTARGGGNTTGVGPLGQRGSWWTSTTIGSNHWSWEMVYNDQRVLNNNYGPAVTMSVRCIH